MRERISRELGGIYPSEKMEKPREKRTMMSNPLEYHPWNSKKIVLKQI
jgi:hypothetical protein